MRRKKSYVLEMLERYPGIMVPLDGFFEEANVKDFGQTRAAEVRSNADYGPQVRPEQLAGKRFTILSIKTITTRQYGDRKKLVVYAEDEAFLDGFDKTGKPLYVAAEMWSTTAMDPQIKAFDPGDLPCEATIIAAGSTWKLAGTDQIPTTDMTAEDVPF